MQDGHTRKVAPKAPTRPPSAFLEQHRAVIVTLLGATAGNEYELDCDRMTIGRGPNVDLAFDDATMSREHATFEVIDDRMRLRDLGSTNGVLVNGASVVMADLSHGDRIELGEHRFQLVVEKRERKPRVCEIPSG